MYELILGLGLLAVVLVGFKAKLVGVALGLLDDPAAEAHKAHTHAVPQVGSVLLFAGLVALTVASYVSGRNTEFIPIVFCASFIGVIGILDDRLKLSWGIRLITLWLPVLLLIVIMPELLVDKLHWSWGQVTDLGFVGGVAFTALCLVGLVIALNMMDGFNGGILSQGLVWSTLFAVMAPSTQSGGFLYLTVVLLIILCFNMPSKLFMGDGGAYALALLMGASAIMMYGSETTSPVYADTIVVWLALPVFDCLRVISRRKMRGLSPFLPQRDHLHHLLMASIHKHAGLVFSFFYTFVAGLAALWVPEFSWLIVLGQLAVLGITVFWASRARPSEPEDTKVSMAAE
ncbi:MULTISPECIES: glycosyltransferase family 4 protein [Kordiimonas]|jgi:UDP-GlcNAc:undecaprenyl-phosphate GlcNAc-1-phosphate transferase|uniref:glycosyltransferase family 4 protein n=1 Tax=Kordiimonas TaxID=288021 RepID=UPI00257A5B54|nr:MraY family glycosyltransferase [Kordiimonas sp. UBA4487]